MVQQARRDGPPHSHRHRCLLEALGARQELRHVLGRGAHHPLLLHVGDALLGLLVEQRHTLLELPLVPARRDSSSNVLLTGAHESTAGFRQTVGLVALPPPAAMAFGPSAVLTPSSSPAWPLAAGRRSRRRPLQPHPGRPRWH